MYKHTPTADARNDATAAAEPSVDSGELSVADLDEVAGGLNPQPLPPIVRDRT